MHEANTALLIFWSMVVQVNSLYPGGAMEPAQQLTPTVDPSTQIQSSSSGQYGWMHGSTAPPGYNESTYTTNDSTEYRTDTDTDWQSMKARLDLYFFWEGEVVETRTDRTNSITSTAYVGGKNKISEV